MAARHKLDAESLLKETKMILGWMWDFRCLTISLPTNKFTAWAEGINEMINSKKMTAKTLETTIGKLSHVSMIIPPVNYFLSCLCKLHFRANNNNQRLTNIPQICINDLKLMKKILKWGNDGISMNQIAYCKPTHVYRLNSCLRGLGGYSYKGFVWHYYLPEDLQLSASNNLLEHIASIISPWIDIIARCLKERDCSLSMTDSTTSEGWTRKKYFKEDHDGIQATIKIQVAREHAARFMTHKIWEYSQ
jgi:hypothetical protein